MEDPKKKQAYLREAILEAGYDAGKFISYLGKVKGISCKSITIYKKENGANINNWSMEELQMVLNKNILITYLFST